MQKGLSLGALLVLAACGNEPASPSPAQRRETPAFTIHEWGLVGVELTDPGTVSVAASTYRAPAQGLIDLGTITSGGSGTGHGVGVGKPVLYVHLDDGTDRARFDVVLGLPSAQAIERWPRDALLEPSERATHTGWRDVEVVRGACTDATPPPTPASPECVGIQDRFCEAAEIRRYAGERDTCLTVGQSRTELLFYRGHSIRAELPAMLVRDGEDLRVRRTATLEGPLFYVEATERDASPRIRAVTEGDLDKPLDALQSASQSPAQVRAALVAEARRRGLTYAEADALVDAWAPAFFDTQRRAGENAAGTPPLIFEQVGRSLLYFAPRPVIDAMLPLETRPPARAIERVFLVRVVDPASRFPGSLAYEGGGRVGHGGGTIGRGMTPCTVDCPVVTVGRPTTTAGLAPEVVRRVVLRNVGQLRYCYDMALRTTPNIAGHVELGFVIGETGQVLVSSVEENDAPLAGVARCMAGATRRFTFPVPDPRSTVIVHAPFTLALRAP